MNEIIDKVLAGMMVDLTDSQLARLKQVMIVAFADYEVTTRTEIEVIDDEWRKYVAMYLVEKRTAGKSDRTIKQYKYILKRVFEDINKPLGVITKADLIMWFYTLKETEKVSNTYLDNIRLILNPFFEWLIDNDVASKNPVRGIEKFKSQKKVKETYSDTELEQIKLACSNERDIALVSLLYSTGMRVGELVKLNRNDIDFDKRSVIVNGKGNKDREVYLSDVSALYVKSYVLSRKDDGEALFVSLKKPYSRLTISGIEDIIRKLGCSAGTHAYPHKYRRTMATNILRKGMPIEEVKEALGHTKIDTTMEYCIVDRDNVQHDHRKYMSA